LNSKELFTKAKTAATSAQILLNARDFDGACNRAYYAMFMLLVPPYYQLGTPTQY
jgi:uncharacterized protein (UPF0332 family)